MELTEQEVKELGGVDADEMYETGATFDAEVAIALLKAGEVVKRKSMEYGFKLHSYKTCDQERMALAAVSKVGQVIAFTQLTWEDILAEDYQIVRFE